MVYKGGKVTAAGWQVTRCDFILHVLSFPVAVSRGATMFSKLGVHFLGLGYYYPSTEKIRQVYPVWCSRLHNHTLFIKKLRKKLGVRPFFWGGGPDPPTLQWLRPCVKW